MRKITPTPADLQARLGALVADMAKRSAQLETHLGDIAAGTAAPDVRILQMLDRITQELQDIAAFLSHMPGTAAGPANLLDGLSHIRLESVRNALLEAQSSAASPADVELF
ncbi:MAG: hypothetical protein Q4G36_06695 [Paracoccus sp. (in: a-proteobacteria)]|nr:hypothetical protein [Paracoccus sp. (in: a-proteobacteria)]